jgi:hypothetical protein
MSRFGRIRGLPLYTEKGNYELIQIKNDNLTRKRFN